ncbi:hypothetical protein SAMN02910265_01940 [Ruminococcus flavefaciens]|uniref:Lipoprotein n=1 Tax=Ruminococcus flavefaciens TaxID=1265 RepID=A0A1H6K081_RUMFL|nr:hypothetical protein [Ruminococcus flavefaciens]SEH65099.1 hypothetical protein SAMN02910265_01940 [Ruminococcus flavefaciens]
MKRFFAGLMSVMVIGAALTGCAEKKNNDKVSVAAEDTEESAAVLTSEEIAKYVEKGADINGFEKYEDAADQFINAVRERDISRLKDVFFIRDEEQYIMPIDQGMFGLLYKQAVALMSEPDYEVDYAKVTGDYIAEDLQTADDIANMYYVYSSINKEVTGGDKELSDDEREIVSQKIQAFDFDFTNIERPVSVTEGKYYEVGLKKGDDLITMLFSLYKVNDEKWLIQTAECNRKIAE